METTVALDNDHKVYVSDWDDGGVWLGLSHRYARMHVTMTKQQAQEMIDALHIALGECPKCGSDEWDTNVWNSGQGVTPFSKYAECSCGHSWTLE